MPDTIDLEVVRTVVMTAVIQCRGRHERRQMRVEVVRAAADRYFAIVYRQAPFEPLALPHDRSFTTWVIDESFQSLPFLDSLLSGEQTSYPGGGALQATSIDGVLDLVRTRLAERAPSAR
jgi:hypothetical protein